ncbi:MAG: TcpD family membrane protein [Eubacteriales bacterium]|nr:TcpD family membrane protein [Eubacteriales bacterium]
MKKIIKKVEISMTRITMGLTLFLAAAMPSFAAITDAGENVGSWLQEQGYYVALGIVVIALIKFLLKKAWVPATAFIVVGGILVFIIASPDALQTAGQALYTLLTR